MNYIDRINEFWKSHEEHSFSTTEIALYFHLLKICNSCKWKNPFKRRNDKIQADLSISYNTLKNARNKLSQANLLEFKSKNGDGNVQYTLLNFDEVTNEVTNEGGDEYNKEKNKNNNKSKSNDLPKETVIGYGKFDLEFINTDFKESFTTWLEYKKQRKESYKTQRSLEICYKQLVEKSNNDPLTAMQIVEQSMGNNWAGLFELKQKGGNSEPRKDNHNDSSSGKLHPALQQ